MHLINNIYFQQLFKQSSNTVFLKILVSWYLIQPTIMGDHASCRVNHAFHGPERLYSVSACQLLPAVLWLLQGLPLQGLASLQYRRVGPVSDPADNND